MQAIEGGSVARRASNGKERRDVVGRRIYDAQAGYNEEHWETEWTEGYVLRIGLGEGGFENANDDL